MRKLLVALVLLALALPAAAADGGAPKAAPELQLRAAYLFNFVRFVTWPDAARPPADAPIVIGVAGDDAFAAVLAQAVGAQRIEGHPLAVRTLRSGDDASGCHAVFAGHGAAALAATLRGKPVLVVVDEDNDPVPGAVISLFQQDKKLRFAIDVDAARQAGLTISSKLLQLAVVRGTPKGGAR